jgi:hypothetical protein
VPLLSPSWQVLPFTNAPLAVIKQVTLKTDVKVFDSSVVGRCRPSQIGRCHEVDDLPSKLEIFQGAAARGVETQRSAGLGRVDVLTCSMLTNFREAPASPNESSAICADWLNGFSQPKLATPIPQTHEYLGGRFARQVGRSKSICPRLSSRGTLEY